MDSNRRALASEGPLGNALPPTGGGHATSSTSIPLPNSSMKKTNMRNVSGGASRMSLAPSTTTSAMAGSRMSMMPGVGHSQIRHSSSQEALRRSTMAQGSIGMGVMSGNRGDGGIYGKSQSTRQPPGSVRRSSVYPGGMGGRQSMAPGTLISTSTRDTRPLRDKSYSAACIQNLTDYLQSRHCPVPITQKTFTILPTKELHAIFRFLVSDYVDSQTAWTKKFEDDAIQILKDLRYPFIDSCGKTALAQPGATTYWPSILGMFTWIVELNKAQSRWGDPEIVEDPLLMEAKDLPLDHPQLEDRLLWDFASKTYSQWFSAGQDEFADEEMELRDIYERLAQESFDQCEKLETEVQKRSVELQQLQAQEPPLKKLEDEYVQLMSDKTKFIAFIDLHRQKAEKIKISNARARAAITDQETELENVRNELSQIETAVAAQNLSPDEVTRMNNERETLQRALEELRVKMAEASQFAYDQEMHVTRSMDRFEGLVQEYTNLAHQIGTIHPGLDSRLGPGEVDYSVDLDLGIEDLNEVQSTGKRLRNVIWPALQAFGESFRKQEQELSDEIIGLEDKHDRIIQEVEKQRQAVEHLEIKLQGVLNQAEGAKASLQAETAEQNSTIATLEKEVLSMSSQNQQGVSQAENELESARIQFSELCHRTSLLEESLINQLESHINVIAKTKDHTVNSFKNLRGFAEAQ